MAYLFCSYNIHKRVENGYCVWERFHMINLKDGSFCVLLVEVYIFLRDFSCIYQSVLIEIDIVCFFTGGVVVLVIKKNTTTYPNTVIAWSLWLSNTRMRASGCVQHKYFCEKTGVSFRSRFLHWRLYSYILVDYFFKCFIPKGYFLSSFVEIRLCVMDEYHIVDVDFIMHED